MSDLPSNLIRVDDEVLAALGLTMADLEKLGLRGFFNRAYDRGFELTVSTKRALSGQGKLSITMDKDVPPPPTIGERG